MSCNLVPASLSKLRIAVQPQSAEIAVYSVSHWCDSMPILIRNRVTQELHTDGRFIAVSCAKNNLQSDLELGVLILILVGLYL